MQRLKPSKRRAAPIIATAPQASSIFFEVDRIVRIGESAGMTTRAAFVTAMLAYMDGMRPPEFERLFQRGEERIQ